METITSLREPSENWLELCCQFVDGNATKIKLLTHTTGTRYQNQRSPAEIIQRTVTLPSCTEMREAASAEGQASLALHLTSSPQSPKPLLSLY